MTVRHYDKDLVSVMVMGVPIMDFADGDIAFEFDEDDWVTEQGHHGSVIRAKKPNSVGTLTVPVLQGSPTSDALSAAVDLDLSTGLGSKPAQVKDTNGTTLVSATSSWCKKRPAVKLGTEPGDVEWVFTLAGAKSHVGQNRLT